MHEIALLPQLFGRPFIHSGESPLTAACYCRQKQRRRNQSTAAASHSTAPLIPPTKYRQPTPRPTSALARSKRLHKLLKEVTHMPSLSDPIHLNMLQNSYNRREPQRLGFY